jgi:hypothetical protein
VGAAQYVEGGLRIAIVGERPAVGAKQRPVAGVGDGRLFEHRAGLRALPGGAQRLAVRQSRRRIPGIGTVALAIGFHRAARIVGNRISLRGQRTRDVGHGLAAAKACGEHRREGHGCKIARRISGKAALSAHGTFNSRHRAHGSGPNVPAIDC